MILFLASLSGWGSADVVTSKLIPVWVESRKTEFEWVGFQRCMDANISLVGAVATAMTL